MAQPDHAAELEKLRELLRLKDATIANLQQYVSLGIIFNSVLHRLRSNLPP